MSERLDRIIADLTHYVYTHRVLPTFREMKELFGVKGTRSVSLIVDKLIEYGFLERGEKGLIPGYRLTAIPVFESVSAGFFAPATEERYEISLDHYLIDKPLDTYFVKVQGDSMKNVGLLSGDFVVVDKTKVDPRDGDVVIAQTDDGGVTVKTFRKKEHKVRLQPENEHYTDIIPVAETRILGSVIGSFRKWI
ncbi:MAG TPA: S24 family peptidase [Candidatus Absconditabacterales bacterium]|nr:S24 family peptidase [Candidatus Absconditabacterales bacterium]